MSHQTPFFFSNTDLQIGDIVTVKLKHPNRRRPEFTTEAAVMGLNEEGHLLIFNWCTIPFFSNGRSIVTPEQVVAIQVTCPAKEAIPHHTSKQFAHGDQAIFRAGEKIVHQGNIIAAFEDRILVQKEDGTIIDGWAVNFSSATTTA